MSAYEPTLSQSPPLVPLETYKDKRDRSPEQPEEFLEWLKKLTGRLRSENTQHNHAAWAKHLTNEQFYRGNQHGKVTSNGEWRNFNRTSKIDPRYVHNLVGGHVDAVTASHILARTDLEVLPIPTGDSDEHAQGKARVAQYIIDYYEHSTFTETFRIRESKLRQFGGGVARYIIWDASAGYQKAKRAKLEDKPFRPPVDDTFTCSNCGESGKLADATEGYGTYNEDMTAKEGQLECPYCHSNDISTNKIEAMEMPTAAGYDEVPTGDCRTISIPMFQVDFDRTQTDFYDALWVRWTRRFRPEVIREILPWWKVKGSGLDEGDEYGQKVGEYLRDSPGNTSANYENKRSGRDESSAPNLVMSEQWWLRPCMYSNAPPLRKDFKVGDKNKPSLIIKAGSRLIDHFPDGCYVWQIEKEPVDFRSEDFRDHLVYIPYRVIPSKVEGDGNEDMNEPQREVNMLDALIFTDIRMTAAPSTYYDSNAVKNADLVGRPDVNVPVRLTRQGQGLQDVVYTPQGRQMPPHVVGYRDWLAQLMQWQSKASNTSTGMTMLAEQTGERTATGAKLVAQGAATQRAPENAAMSDGDVRTAKIWLKLFLKNAVDERYIPLRGKNSSMEGTWLKGSDLGEVDSELLVVARSGSNVPRSPEDEQNAYMTALGVCGGPEGVMMMAQNAPEMLKQIEDTFRVKFKISEFDLDARQCRMRLDKMKMATEQATAMVQATGDAAIAIPILLQSAPIGRYDNHEAAIKYFINWLKQDEAMEGHPLLLSAVEARIGEHEQAIKALMQEQMADEMALQQPMQEEAQAQAAQQAEQQAGMQAEQSQQQMEMEGAKAEQDAAVRDEQRQAQIEDKAIDEESKQLDHQRNLELERVRQQGQKELAKMKPKGASK